MCKSRTAKWAGVRAIAPVEVVEEGVLLRSLLWQLKLLGAQHNDDGLDAAGAESDEAQEADKAHKLGDGVPVLLGPLGERRVGGRCHQAHPTNVDGRKDGDGLQVAEVLVRNLKRTRRGVRTCSVLAQGYQRGQKWSGRHSHTRPCRESGSRATRKERPSLKTNSAMCKTGQVTPGEWGMAGLGLGLRCVAARAGSGVICAWHAAVRRGL